MQTATLVPVEEYLKTTYRPDRDYVDGVLVERNVGEQYHSDLQGELIYFFRSRRREWRVIAYPEQRIQTGARRFRIPDICVVLEPKPAEQVFTQPPFICIEILSPEDTVASTQDRIDDYLRFGVPNVWVIDPRSRRAWVCTSEGSREVKDGILRTQDPPLAISLAEIFANLEP